MDYLAFDFDGVICNSAGETGRTAWRAAHGLWPDVMPSEPGEDFIERFPRLRPVIETGFENVPLVGLFVRGASDDEILADFARLSRELIDGEGLDRDDLRARFGSARDTWIASDIEGWLAAQGFYPGVVDAINGLSAPRCVITTKEDRFTRVLVERAGLEVEADRIYALEAFEGRGKRSVLEALSTEFPQARLHFFEDRYVTLDRIRDLDRTDLYLVDWGYNTPAERQQAAADTRIRVLGRADFEAVLAGATGMA